MQVRAPGVLDTVPDAAAGEDGRPRPDGHSPAVEDRRAAAGVHEEDLILMLVQVHRDRGARTEALTPHGEPGRPHGLAVHLDRHVAAAGRRTQAQRLPIPGTEHEPRWLHR
ncbi:MAG TPA: hypothetical protein VGZ23_12280 [bacterium]|nr:hypothetical protein [bacterium]